MSIGRTAQLQELMQKVGINSLRELYRSTGTSAHTINKLRSGNLETLRWESIVKISDTLQISIDEFTVIFGEQKPKSQNQSIQILQQEYQQLQQQLQQQRNTLQAEFQFESLQILESFLTYFPTAKYAATNNPDFPASKLFPLVGSIDRLIQSWGVTVIGEVGSQVQYAPRWHQLVAGTASPDQPVTVRYVGYRQGEKLIFRAKVGC
ncbi:MAG: helix-turn-helix transcriptional regulator [Chamaesiphon sp.]|nr:helix-turn-helix transcriptional regulator [Chamaesiphon sp.]